MTEYMSKMQVRNILVKQWGKSVMSRYLKGRVCYESSSGFELTEAENGYVTVSYYKPMNFRNYEGSVSRMNEWNEKAAELLIGLGFERDGKNFRKARVKALEAL